jgi:hypothetical protein
MGFNWAKRELKLLRKDNFNITVTIRIAPVVDACATNGRSFPPADRIASLLIQKLQEFAQVMVLLDENDIIQIQKRFTSVL